MHVLKQLNDSRLNSMLKLTNKQTNKKLRYGNRKGLLGRNLTTKHTIGWVQKQWIPHHQSIEIPKHTSNYAELANTLQSINQD